MNKRIWVRDTANLAARPNDRPRSLRVPDVEWPTKDGWDGTAGPHMTVESLLGGQVLRISGGAVDASSAGRTEGYSLLLPEAFEREASGKRVHIAVVARKSTDVPRAGLAVAYSTNEVGNSGWKCFLMTDDFEQYSFEWDVPKLIAGGGDYVGLSPILGYAIELRSVTAQIL